MKSIELNISKKLLKKTLLPALLVIASVATIPAFAQKKLSEGTIYYDIVINTGSEKPQEADFFNGATSVVYIKGLKSRTEMVSSLGTQSTIIDGSNAITILKEYGEQKYMIKLTPADWLDANKKNQNISFTYDPSQTKTIQGYVCKKAVGKYADGTSFTAWYTTDLVPENKNYDPTTKGLPGVAMEYETTLGNMKVTYTVSRISFAPVPASKFDLPKSGFRVLTYKESKGV
jgi:GLPGLI family protein